MKMGTTPSPWRYDAAPDQTLQSANPRRPAILRYASWAGVFPISQRSLLTFDSGRADQSRDRRDGPIGDIAVSNSTISLGALPLTKLQHEVGGKIASGILMTKYWTA